MSVAGTENLLMVRLHTSDFDSWVYDHEAAAELADQKGAKKGDVHTTKRRLAKEATKPMTDITTAAYFYHTAVTMPTGNKGERIITTNLYETYNAKMQEFKTQLENAKAEFAPLYYSKWVPESKERLNGMAKDEDYPPVEKVLERFQMSWSFLPLPTSCALPSTLLAEQAESIRKSVEQEMESLQKNAMKSLWDRMYDAVAHMAERMGSEGKLFGSVIGNVKDLTELLKSLNFSNDPELESLRQKVEARLSGFDPEDLRKNRTIRNQVAEEAKAIAFEISTKRKLRVE